MLRISPSLMGFLEVPTVSKSQVDNLAERILDNYREICKRSSATKDAFRDNSGDAVSETQVDKSGQLTR
ncbi:MAG: hypothetical protein ACR2KT_03995 [Methylocella sp.]